MPKATNAEMNERIETVKKFLLEGAPRADILQYCAKMWKISTRQSDKLIKFATDRYLQEAEKAGIESLKYGISARLNLFYKAQQASDHATSLRILKDLSELMGDYPEKKIDLSGGFEFVFTNETKKN